MPAQQQRQLKEKMSHTVDSILEHYLNEATDLKSQVEKSDGLPESLKSEVWQKLEGEYIGIEDFFNSNKEYSMLDENFERHPKIIELEDVWRDIEELTKKQDPEFADKIYDVSIADSNEGFVSYKKYFMDKK